MPQEAWWGVDFDGTLAYHEQGEMELGEPIPEMLERVKRWIAKGRKVKIFTARVGKHDGETDEDIEEQRRLVEDWTEKHIGKRLEVTCEKDYKMIQLWDDRAVQVISNTGIPVRHDK